MSLEETRITIVSKVGAVWVGDADASALLVGAGHVFSNWFADVVYKMTIEVPANQTLVVYFPGSSGHDGQRHGRHEKEN